MRLSNVIQIAVIGLCVPLLTLNAQEARGTILGRVTDRTGAVIGAAKVDAVNTDTGVRYSSTSNSSGDYIIPYLNPGPYTITVEQPGFKTYTRTGIVVRESDRLTADVRMEVGD